MDTTAEFKFTKIGKIPADWKIEELKNISEIITGSTPKTNRNEFWNGDYMFVTPSDINGNKYMSSTERYVTEEALKISRAIPENSIMVTCIASIGKMAISKEKCMTNQQINSIIPINSCDSQYLYYYLLKNKPMLELLASQTTVPIINKSTFSKIKIMVPPLKEQQKIAEILSTVDEQIEQTDQLIEKTKELKKGLMQQLLIKGIGHTEFKHTELGEIPGEWEVTSLKNLGSFFKGKGIAKKDMSTNGYKCILYGQLYTTYKEIINEVDTYTDINIKNPVIGEKNDLLIPSSGETPFDIATASSLQVNEVYIGGDINVFRPANQMNSDFLSYQINSVRKFELSKLAQGSSIYHLYKDNLEKFDVLVPPLKEQKQIVEILSAVDEEIEGYQEEKAKYEELKKGLMQQLLTGKTRVKVD